MLGIPDSYAQSSGGFIDAGAQEHYLYAQDSWKVAQLYSQLWACMADQWPADGPLQPRPGDQLLPARATVRYLSTAPTGLVFPGDNGCTSSGIYTGFKHFAPRLGLAWAPHASGTLGRLTGDQGKFSIRAGVGIYYNQVEEELSLQNLTAPPFSLSDAGIGDVGGSPSFAAPFNSVNPGTVPAVTTYNGVLAPNPITPPCTSPGQKNCNSPVGGATLANKYPFTPPAAGSNVDFTFFEPMSLNVLDPRFAVPYSVNYNLTVQRELPGQMIMSVGYVGAQGRHLERAYELNYSIPGLCAADPACIGTTGDRAQQGFFFPQNFRYPAIIPGSIGPNTPNGELAIGSVGQQATDGNSKYNSLQVSLNKRLTHGLSFLLSLYLCACTRQRVKFRKLGFRNSGHQPIHSWPELGRFAV